MRSVRVAGCISSLLLTMSLLGISMAIADPLGNGTIIVYEDAGRTIRAPTDGEYYYFIYPGRTYYITIVRIIEYDPAVTSKVDVKIKTESGTPYEVIFEDVPLVYEGYVYDGGTHAWYHVHHVDVPAWTAPGLAEGTTLIVYYGSVNPGTWFRAHSVRCRLGGMFTVPEVTLGTLGVMGSLLASLGIFVTARRRLR